MSPADIGRHFGMIYSDDAAASDTLDLTPDENTPDILRVFNFFWYESLID
jgi:hypothetical protein